MNNINNLPSALGKWINTELYNAQLYRVLSKSAPDDRSRHILEEFSDDSRDTAETMMKAYKNMTGYKFIPKPLPLKENGSYRSVIRGRIGDEVRLSKMYRNAYMNIQGNYTLRRIVFSAYHNALEHAVTLLELMSGS